MTVIPNFVAIGHITRDMSSDGSTWNIGGAAAYAAVAAHRLGRRTGIVTSHGTDLTLHSVLPAEIEIASTVAAESTIFRNVDRGAGRREQYVMSRAQRLDVEQVPYAWLDAQIVLAAPVLGEIDSSMLGRFRKSLVGAAGQGWLRRWVGNPDIPLSQRGLDALGALPPIGALFLSNEDFNGDSDELSALMPDTPIIVVTLGAAGARLRWQGAWREVPPFPATERDATGAGDVFAAAFLIRLAETRDPLVAATFASAAASLSVEAIGVDCAPTREAVERKIADE